MKYWLKSKSRDQELTTGTPTAAGLSYAGRRLIGKGMPGAPKVIGNQLYTPLVDKVGKANKGPRAHFQNTKVASSSGPGGRLSWQQLYPE